MTRALILKELRALRPWVVLSSCIGLIEIASSIVHQTDMLSLASEWDDLGRASSFMLWTIAFAIGTGVVSREQDDGTLVFLDGLPVSRLRVFTVKCCMTCAVLAIAPVVTLTNLIVKHLLSRGSLDTSLHLDILLQLFGLQTFAVVQGVFVGAALGTLRSLTWLVAAALAVSLSLLVERVPRTAFLSPNSLLAVRLTGSGVGVDGETLAAQVFITAGAALIAWWGFVRAGRPSFVANLGKRPALGAAIAIVTIAVTVTAVGMLGTRSRAAEADRDDEASGVDGATFESSPPAQTATKHYHIFYAATEARQALELAGEADDVFERVHAMLGAPLGESIDVDTSGSLRNTEGTAYFGRVRIWLGERASVVLAHETSHVVAQRLAGRERDWLWDRVPVLNEGLATYVEQKFEADTGKATEQTQANDAQDALLLAALYARHELLVAEISDYRLLSTTHDESLKYPLGAAVIRAMVRLYGPESITRLVRAFANEKLPAELTGLPLMETVFQTAAMDFAAVVAELFEQVAEDAREHAAELAALPRPRVRVVRRDDSIGVQVLCDEDTADSEPRRFYLRFKPQRDSGFDTYSFRVARGDRPVWRSASHIRQGEVCVQVGLRLARGRALYEPWTCLPTADAAVWASDDEDDELDD